MIASTTCPWCGEKEPHEPCPVAARYASKPAFENSIKAQPAAGQGKCSNDGPYVASAASGNQTNQTDEDAAFEVRRFEPDGGGRIAHVWRIFASGKIDGFNRENHTCGLVVFNRIPALIAQAREHQNSIDALMMKPGHVTRTPRPRPTLFWDGMACGLIIGTFIVAPCLFAILLGFR